MKANNLQELLDKIDSRILRHSSRKIRLKAPINRIRIAVPTIRRELKNLAFLSDNDLLQMWDFAWKNSSYYESMSLALYFYQGKSLSKQEFATIKRWVDRCGCWEHSDDLSKIFAKVMQDNPEWVLPVYRKWNKAKSLWKRRQSVVGLIEYASKRIRVLPFDELISFVDPLLGDEEYYVQKGIGWTLREIYNVYPKQTLTYITKNLLDIKPIAYTSATEKLDKKLKIELNEKRKNSRKSSRDNS